MGMGIILISTLRSGNIDSKSEVQKILKSFLINRHLKNPGGYNTQNIVMVRTKTRQNVIYVYKPNPSS